MTHDPIKLFSASSTANQLPNIIPAHSMSARAVEKQVLTQVRSALAQLSTAQQQNVLAKLGGGQAGKNPHENVFIFVSFKVLGPQIPPAPAHVSSGMSAITGSTLTAGLQFSYFTSSSIYQISWYL